MPNTVGKALPGKEPRNPESARQLKVQSHMEQKLAIAKDCVKKFDDAAAWIEQRYGHFTDKDAEDHVNDPLFDCKEARTAKLLMEATTQSAGSLLGIRDMQTHKRVGDYQNIMKTHPPQFVEVIERFPILCEHLTDLKELQKEDYQVYFAIWYLKEVLEDDPDMLLEVELSGGVLRDLKKNRIQWIKRKELLELIIQEKGGMAAPSPRMHKGAELEQKDQDTTRRHKMQMCIAQFVSWFSTDADRSSDFCALGVMGALKRKREETEKANKTMAAAKTDLDLKPAAKMSRKLLPYLLSADADEIEEQQSTSDEVELMGVASTAGVAAAMPYSAMSAEEQAFEASKMRGHPPFLKDTVIKHKCEFPGCEWIYSIEPNRTPLIPTIGGKLNVFTSWPSQNNQVRVLRTHWRTLHQAEKKGSNVFYPTYLQTEKVRRDTIESGLVKDEVSGKVSGKRAKELDKSNPLRHMTMYKRVAVSRFKASESISRPNKLLPHVRLAIGDRLTVSHTPPQNHHHHAHLLTISFSICQFPRWLAIINVDVKEKLQSSNEARNLLAVVTDLRKAAAWFTRFSEEFPDFETFHRLAKQKAAEDEEEDEEDDESSSPNKNDPHSQPYMFFVAVRAAARQTVCELVEYEKLSIKHPLSNMGSILDSSFNYEDVALTSKDLSSETMQALIGKGRQLNFKDGGNGDDGDDDCSNDGRVSGAGDGGGNDSNRIGKGDAGDGGGNDSNRIDKGHAGDGSKVTIGSVAAGSKGTNLVADSKGDRSIDVPLKPRLLSRGFTFTEERVLFKKGFLFDDRFTLSDNELLTGVSFGGLELHDANLYATVAIKLLAIAGAARWPFNGLQVWRFQPSGVLSTDMNQLHRLRQNCVAEQFDACATKYNGSMPLWEESTGTHKSLMYKDLAVFNAMYPDG
jgi:hypothetical protein